MSDLDRKSDSVDPVSGVLPRAHILLRLIANSGVEGLRLKDIAEQAEIARPTVYRMLRDLSSIGLVHQLENRKYTLGSEMYWLGQAAPLPFAGLPAIQIIAKQFAQTTRDTVYVSVRESVGVRYLLRLEGDYPLQTRVVAPGELKPFTSSYSGLALLANLPPATQEAALNHIVLDTAFVEEDPWSPAKREQHMRDALEQTRETGWCSGEGLVMPGLSGIAAPVPSKVGPPVAAVSVSAADSRLTAQRALELAPELLEIAEQLSAVIEP